MNKKLLIIHQGALGDIVSIFPSLIRLREKFSRIDALFKKSIGELASSLKLIDKAYPAEAAFFSSMFSHKVDPAAVKLLCLYDEIIIFSYSQELEGIIRGFAGNKVHRIPPRPDRYTKIHILNHILEQLAESRLIEDPAPPESDFYSRLIGNEIKNYRPDSSNILFHPGSGSIRKNWPALFFIELFKVVKSMGMNPEIILGPAEQNLLEIFDASIPAESKIHLPADLPELMKILKQSGGFIGNDSGVSHLSAFLGIPTAVIFGPSDPKRWKPFGRSVAVIRPETDCTPCFETEKSNCADMKCLELTTPEMVVRSLLKIKRKCNGR
jgi:ADP-heptose:LPS heptosyltransferase